MIHRAKVPLCIPKTWSALIWRKNRLRFESDVAMSFLEHLRSLVGQPHNLRTSRTLIRSRAPIGVRKQVSRVTSARASLCRSRTNGRSVPLSTNLPYLGNDSRTLWIIGVIGMACGKPFLVHSPGNSITSPLISSCASSVTSLRRAPDRISSLTRAPAAPPSALQLPR
jgi:hypothetical protein